MEKNYSLTLKASAALCSAAGKMISMIASGNAGSVKTLISGEKINGKYPFYIDEEIPDNLYGLFVKAEDENGDQIISEELSRAVKLGKYAVTIQSASGSRMDGRLVLMLDEVKAETVNTEELDHRIKSALDKAVFEGRMSREGGLDRIRYMAENHLPVNLIIRVCDQWQGETNVVKKKAMYVDPELKETVLAGEPGKVCDAIMNALAGTPMILKGPKSTGKNTLVNSVLYTLGYEMEYDVANADKVTADYMSHERTDNSAAEQVAKMRPEDLRAAEIAKAKAAAGLALGKEDEEALTAEAVFKLLQAQCSSVRIISSYKAFARALMNPRSAMFLDEINMGDANSLVTLLHGILDHSIDTVDIEGMGKVPLRRDFVMFAAMNCGYAGAQEMNDATRSRFCSLILGQPGSIVPILKSAMAYELNGGTMDEKYFSEAGNFYDQLKAAVMGDGVKGQYRANTISDVCLNVRGIVRALRNVAMFEGCTTLKHELKTQVINPCDDKEIPYLIPILNLAVDC